MVVEKNKVVTIDYKLVDDSGNVIDQSEDGNFAYLHGARNIIPGLEEALAGKSQGEDVEVRVPPEEAYGVRDNSKTQVVPRELFPADTEIEVGMQFHAQGPDGQNLLITVVGVNGDQVTVDGNHPLAGVGLNFQVKVRDIRDATEEEIGHGHAHGPGNEPHS